MKFNVKEAPANPAIKAGQLWINTFTDTVYLVVRHSVPVYYSHGKGGGYYTLVSTKGFGTTAIEGISEIPSGYTYYGMLEVEQ